jgi:uncharacterized SAM-binding protein YcdF (DUF218 family)
MRQWLRVRPGGWAERVIRAGAGLMIVLLVAWVLGFAWFVRAVTRLPPPPPHADGIVVLTGGAERVQTALEMLVAGDAERLLVSGIGGGADLRDLASHAGVDWRPVARFVTLGRGAASTHGNAEETAAWAHANGIRSLIVVTAFYHMPRALTEIGRAVPGVRLYPVPVLPPELRGARPVTSWTGLRLLTQEYTKLVAAELGVTSLEHDPGPLLSAASTRRRG